MRESALSPVDSPSIEAVQAKTPKTLLVQLLHQHQLLIERLDKRQAEVALVGVVVLWLSESVEPFDQLFGRARCSPGCRWP